MNMSDSDESIDLPSLSPLFRRRASPPLDLRTNDSQFKARYFVQINKYIFFLFFKELRKKTKNYYFIEWRIETTSKFSQFIDMTGYVEVYDREGAIIQSGEVSSTTNDISTVNMN
ncbi:hypothetical protein TNCT_116961 [Trichonephila clavata]|uniref:Uncharacterized protein n=1 Tax=Trichonephila clavata TaxID=2740835 RepID=A0A8X6K373_TRICU|nr:hypothetical protein TNCT_116961 [Trichonephila clavata]